MEERRAFPRKCFIDKIEYYPTDNPGHRNVAYSFNLSLGGMGLSVNTIIDNGITLDLMIYQAGKKEPIKARGKVIWGKKFNDIDEQRIGIEFTDIRWNDIKDLTAMT